MSELTARLEKLEKQRGRRLLPKERAELLESIAATIREDLGQELLQTIDERYGEEAIKQAPLGVVLQDFEAIRSRLGDEIFSLQKRANLNLAIGTGVTLLAAALLAAIVFGTDTEFEDTTALLSFYLPRLAFMIFIEFFAFFFLRMYKVSLADARFYQNEMTNIESRLIALKAAMLEDREAEVAAIVLTLAETERNFILQKGESAVDPAAEPRDKLSARLDKILALLEKE